jgi:hypothetical protein
MTYYVAVLDRRRVKGQRTGKVLASEADETWVLFKHRVARQQGSVVGEFVTDEQEASRFLRRALGRDRSREIVRIGTVSRR